VERFTQQGRAVTGLLLLLLIAGGCFAGDQFSVSSTNNATDDSTSARSNALANQKFARTVAKASPLRVVAYTFPESNGVTIANPPWVPVFGLNMVGDGSGGGRTPKGAPGAWVHYVSPTYAFGPEFYVQGRFRLDSDYSTEHETSELQIITDRGFWYLAVAPRSGFWFLGYLENGTDHLAGGSSSGSYTTGDLIRVSVTGTGATQTYKVYLNRSEVYSVAGTGSVPLTPGLRTHDATIYNFAAANTAIGFVPAASAKTARAAAYIRRFARSRNRWLLATTAVLGFILLLVIYMKFAA
jgi:hypothetical protein